MSEFTYGRFEARMKLPGLCPAFWLWLSDDHDTLPLPRNRHHGSHWKSAKDYWNHLLVRGTHDAPDSLGSDYKMSVDYSLDYNIYALNRNIVKSIILWIVLMFLVVSIMGVRWLSNQPIYIIFKSWLMILALVICKFIRMIPFLETMLLSPQWEV